MQGIFLRKYGIATTIPFHLFKVDGVDFRTDAVHASGDTKIMKDEGAEANTASGFTDEGQGYSIPISATEMQAARIPVYVVDQTATKVWLDTVLYIETYGHASAQHAFDLDTATVNLSAATETQIDNIETDTNELQTDDVPGLISALNDPTAAVIADQVWNEAKSGHVAAGSFGQEVQAHALSTEIAALNDLSAGQVNAEVGTALTDIHLDHLLATDYNPASKPGTATALLNELVESDAGISRYTANALEQAPTGGSAPTANEIADQVWNEAKSGHVGAGSFGQEVQAHALTSEVNTLKGATFNTATDSLEAIRNRGDAAWTTGAGAGSGAITFTYTLLNSVDSAPIPDADVWATSDQAGNNLLASGRTDQNGEAAFYLDAGTVYVWRQKSGWNFDNPDTEVVA